MIRVVVADDSSTSRALLVGILASDPGIAVIAEARDGAEAVELVRRLRPDVVTMDIQMPRLDGFAATQEIMVHSPTPIVVVSAMPVVGEAETAVRALAAGALTVLRKPPDVAQAGFEEKARQILETVKAMSQVKVVGHRLRPKLERALPKLPPAGRARIVAIATSTGGPAALQAILGGLPAGFPLPILVVQHLAAGFMTGFANWLGSVSPLDVRVAAASEPLRRATVYLAPDDRHLGVGAGGSVELSEAPPIDGFRPSGSHLFESAAASFGGGTVAVILTGMGSDGLAGLRTVRRVGGRILAQDEPTSVVFGMPGAAVSAGLADLVLPVEMIAPALVDIAAERGATLAPGASRDEVRR